MAAAWRRGGPSEGVSWFRGGEQKGCDLRVGRDGRLDGRSVWIDFVAAGFGLCVLTFSSLAVDCQSLSIATWEERIPTCKDYLLDRIVRQLKIDFRVEYLN
jgi:hypothetical protein